MSDSVHAMDFKLGTNWSDLYTPTPCSAMTAANVDTTNAVWLSGPAGSYPRPLAAHTYGLVRYAPEQNELVLLGRRFTKGQVCGANISNDLTGPIAHFNLGTRIWSFSTDAATTNLSAALPASDYDPVSKKMVILGSGGLVLYDPGTRQSSGPLKLLASTNGVPFDTESRFVVYADHMVYYPPNDRFYYFARNGQVFELALNRSNPAASTIDDIATTGPNPSSQGEFGFAFDSKNSVIGGGVSNGAFYIFTPQTRTWSAVPIPGGSPGPMAFHMIVYDPINNVFVFRTTYEAGQRTWAFRYRN